MANKREKLENQAVDLGLDLDFAEYNDEDLQNLITEAEQEQAEAERIANRPISEGARFFKSAIAGLAVALSESDDRGEVGVEEVRFEPYEIWNEKRGEHYRIGLLATDDDNAIQVLEDDPNVEEIDEDAYNQTVEEGKKIPY